MSKRLLFPLLAYFLSLVAYAIFSYSLTAPNLILSNWEPYWEFQTWMWRTFFNDRVLLSQTYLGVLMVIVGAYFWLVHSLTQATPKLKSWLVVGLMVAPLFLSNNALSYDVFNYIFNAKMVVVYQADPHVETATNYLDDDWTRFMHNRHTPAPYGYGWTVLSLVPYTLGLGKFLLTWLSFRAFSVLSLGLLALVYFVSQHRAPNSWAWVVLLNPLLLIEMISNSHNDLWMMVPALLGLHLLLPDSVWFRKAPAKTIGLSLVLLAVSASIKLATIALLPVWLLLVASRWTPFSLTKPLTDNWAYVASVLMFLPLLTLRSQQFHPWYLSWVLIWLPYFNFRHRVSTTWAVSLLVLSFSSLARYLPYFSAGNYDGDVLWQQKMITWLPFVLSLLIFRLASLRSSKVR